MTMQTKDDPPILLLGTSGKVPSKANKPSLFLHFWCCFGHVQADTEQLGQGISKVILRSLAYVRTGIVREALGYSIGKSLWRLKTTQGQLDDKVQAEQWVIQNFLAMLSYLFPPFI